MTALVQSLPALPPALYSGPELYNKLPTLGEADEAFTPEARTILVSQVGDLLASFGALWGLCLVHAHCSLEVGETMLGRGNISQPEKDVKLGEVFPERWLADGRPYEFNVDKSQPPPAALVTQFNTLISEMGLSGTLGLYYVGDKVPEVVLERTEGRANIIEVVTGPVDGGSSIQTGWASIKGQAGMPVTMACVINCDSRITRNAAVHKGTRSHT
ncbi:hypothetical protein B0H17DRAFT_1139776 [Mycena rosella]|uniref:Uncharacterized protein n=1 Tax=Mycena rosella TaxID=1033263 RepID=A0AAD7D3Z7_MYCRO|nr:hypothetical protein B0H17DRAFT_1139776 [Mycena rosella]